MDIHPTNLHTMTHIHTASDVALVYVPTNMFVIHKHPTKVFVDTYSDAGMHARAGAMARACEQCLLR